MPRFVILRHEVPVAHGRPSHWDFMLEQADDLLTWSLLEIPGPGQSVPAEALPHHRKLYLDYRGPISGDRGEVQPWDAGRFEWLQCDKRQVVVRLQGRQLQGTVRLVKPAQGGASWSMTFEPELATVERRDPLP